MKAHFPIFFFIFFITLSCSSPQNNVQKPRFKGHVKSILSTRYEAKVEFGEIVKGEKKSVLILDYPGNYVFYDINGNPIEFYGIKADGSFVRLESSTYIKNRLDSVIECPWWGGDFANRSVCKYDNKSRKIEEIKYEKNILTNRKVYKYDNESRIIEERIFKNNSLDYRREYIYENDKLTKVIWYDIDKSYINMQYIYDSNGRLVEELYFSDTSRYTSIFDNEKKDGKIEFTNKTTYEYDKEGRLSQKKEYSNMEDSLKLEKCESNYYNDSNGEVTKTTTSYEPGSEVYSIETEISDKNGQLIKTKSEYQDWDARYRNSEHTFKCDKMGQLIEFKIYYPVKNIHEIHTYTYLYDKIGNVVKTIEYVDFRPAFITEEKIEYYDHYIFRKLFGPLFD